MGILIPSLSSGVVSVPAGNATFGPWTTLFTPPVPLSGFWLQLNTSAIGNGYGVFNLGFGSGTPSAIPIQYGAFDGGYQGFIYIPLFCPAGVEIQIQLYEENGTTDGADVSLIGDINDMDNTCRVIQCVGSTGTGWGVSIGTGWTQIGTSLNMRCKSMSLLMGTLAATADFNNNSIGFGPSATSVTPIVNGLVTSSTFTYVTYAMNFKSLSIPPGQGIWANGNSGSNSRCMMYLGY